MTAPEIEKALAPKMEGNVYVHYWMSFFFDTYSLSTTYYTVVDGKVYMIGPNNELRPTQDTLFNTQHECKCLGKHSYKDKEFANAGSKTVPYSKIKRFFKLDLEKS